MSARSLGSVLVALASVAAPGCSPSDPLAEVAVLVDNDGRATPPDHLLFSWLWCRSFIRRDERVPESGALVRGANPVASIVVRLDARSPTKRGVFIRGMVGDGMVSAGMAVVNVEPGARSQVTVRLYGGPLPDSSDGVPEMVDWCAEARAATADGGDDAVPAADRADGGMVDVAPAGANQPPVVSAGPAQTVPTPATEVVLPGTVSDDGLPAPPRLTVRWSQVSGPGSTSFKDPAMAATTARFSVAGAYVLRLAASDGAATASADVTINVLGLEEGLVGLWRFEDAAGTTAQDSSGRGNHATLMGPAALVGRARIGMGALDLTGDSDRAVVNDPPADRLDFGTADFTVSLWVKTAQTPQGAPDIVVKWPASGRDNGPRNGFAVTLPAGAAVFKAFSDGQRSFSVTGPPINDDQWHHVAGRRSADELTLFVDGRQVGATKHGLGSVSNDAPLQMGTFGTSPNYDFDGLIDEVRMYARALSAAEIAALAGGMAP